MKELAGSTFGFQQTSHCPGAAISPIRSFDALPIAFAGGWARCPGL